MKKGIIKSITTGLLLAASFGFVGCGQKEEVPAQIKNISVTGQRAEYETDSNFLDGLKVKVTRDNGKVEEVTLTEEMIQEMPDMTTEGEKTVVVNYGGKTYQFTFNVKLSPNRIQYEKIRKFFEENDFKNVKNLSATISYGANAFAFDQIFKQEQTDLFSLVLNTLSQKVANNFTVKKYPLPDKIDFNNNGELLDVYIDSAVSKDAKYIYVFETKEDAEQCYYTISSMNINYFLNVTVNGSEYDYDSNVRVGEAWYSFNPDCRAKLDEENAVVLTAEQIEELIKLSFSIQSPEQKVISSYIDEHNKELANFFANMISHGLGNMSYENFTEFGDISKAKFNLLECLKGSVANLKVNRALLYKSLILSEYETDSEKILTAEYPTEDYETRLKNYAVDLLIQPIFNYWASGYYKESEDQELVSFYEDIENSTKELVEKIFANQLQEADEFNYANGIIQKINQLDEQGKELLGLDLSYLKNFENFTSAVNGDYKNFVSKFIRASESTPSLEEDDAFTGEERNEDLAIESYKQYINELADLVALFENANEETTFADIATEIAGHLQAMNNASRKITEAGYCSENILVLPYTDYFRNLVNMYVGVGGTITSEYINSLIPQDIQNKPYIQKTVELLTGIVDVLNEELIKVDQETQEINYNQISAKRVIEKLCEKFNLSEEDVNTYLLAYENKSLTIFSDLYQIVITNAGIADDQFEPVKKLFATFDKILLDEELADNELLEVFHSAFSHLGTQFAEDEQLAQYAMIFNIFATLTNGKDTLSQTLEIVYNNEGLLEALSSTLLKYLYGALDLEVEDQERIDAIKNMLIEFVNGEAVKYATDKTYTNMVFAKNFYNLVKEPIVEGITYEIAMLFGYDYENESNEKTKAQLFDIVDELIQTVLFEDRTSETYEISLNEKINKLAMFVDENASSTKFDQIIYSLGIDKETEAEAYNKLLTLLEKHYTAYKASLQPEAEPFNMKAFMAELVTLVNNGKLTEEETAVVYSEQTKTLVNALTFAGATFAFDADTFAGYNEIFKNLPLPEGVVSIDYNTLFKNVISDYDMSEIIKIEGFTVSTELDENGNVTKQDLTFKILANSGSEVKIAGFSGNVTFKISVEY